MGPSIVDMGLCGYGVDLDEFIVVLHFTHNECTVRNIQLISIAYWYWPFIINSLSK